MSFPNVGRLVTPEEVVAFVPPMNNTIGVLETIVIESVEDIPSADALVKLVVDFGDRKRTVVAGLKKERADVRVQARRGVSMAVVAAIVGEVEHRGKAQRLARARWWRHRWITARQI